MWKSARHKGAGGHTIEDRESFLVSSWKLSPAQENPLLSGKPGLNVSAGSNWSSSGRLLLYFPAVPGTWLFELYL